MRRKGHILRKQFSETYKKQNKQLIASVRLQRLGKNLPDHYYRTSLKSQDPEGGDDLSKIGLELNILFFPSRTLSTISQ